MKYKILHSKSYKKAIKRINDSDVELIESIINRLANDETLEPKYKDHKLKGDFLGCRECHIKPDLLLIYKKQDNLLILTCLDVGSHSKLF